MSFLRWAFIYVKYTRVIKYVFHFYRPNWIYPYGFSVCEIIQAIDVYLRKPGVKLRGVNSVDRENIRDLIFADRECVG